MKKFTIEKVHNKDSGFKSFTYESKNICIRVFYYPNVSPLEYPWQIETYATQSFYFTIEAEGMTRKEAFKMLRAYFRQYREIVSKFKG